MREFWDSRALEDPYYFVDDRRAYRDPDHGSFWSDGERDLERLLELLGVSIADGDTALDIGCGVGRLTCVIAHRAAQVYAIDVSGEMLERARRQHAALRNVDWVLGDGATLQPIADESVDVCISHVVFQHIPDPRITLGYVREIGRVLKPGGRAAFQLSNDPRAHRPRRGARMQLRRLAARLGRAPRGQDDSAWRGSAVELQDLRAAATASGLTIERIVGEGTQFCLIGALKTSTGRPSAQSARAPAG
jgi:SAM-dependent methyltransferase